MASDDSDDEPLSVLAASKRLKGEADEDDSSNYEPLAKKKKEPLSRKLNVTIKINRKLKQVVAPPVIERPIDVWLYLKDLNPTGPYTCLLCTDWFINRSKMVMHYALNHRKDFCGICRYFVPDREAWIAHESFHTPWPCSQCVETFPTETTLRSHLRLIHNLVHCRLCHFRVPADEQYDTHLFQKHNVSNVACKDNELLWEIDTDSTQKFVCLLCTKVDIALSTFFNHFMGYHHFTLKCLTGLVAGRDPPFQVNGAEISSKFLEDQLRINRTRFGYVDLEPKAFESEQITENTKTDPTSDVKQENLSDEETEDVENKVDKEIESNSNIEYIKIDYKGMEDYDITLTEIIILDKSYYYYLNNNLTELTSDKVPENSNVNYAHMTPDLLNGLFCALCSVRYDTVNSFMSHINKMHNIKMIPQYTCRVCATTFHTQSELKTHITEELGDFDDLWICQFCDKEFDNRESTRKHLTEHWSILEFDNCFSPHLGFKCKFCPTLFWNEPDREKHQVNVHVNKYKEQFYKCDTCSQTYSDKVWFIHHYFDKHFVQGQKYSYLIKCSICCLVLGDFDEMRGHFDKEHPEARKLYCSYDTCKYKPLSQRKSLKLHVKTIHSQIQPLKGEKPVNCGACGREFASSRACTAHMSQVHGPGKFKCKLCRDVLNTLDERKLHYLLCHPGRHPFECNECGKSFQYKSSLYMHKQEHMPNRQSYTCTYCGKIFAKKDSFREHVQIHEGPRHACSYCPMRFVQRSNMLRHERRHTGERPYHCPECPRTFADKGACTAHTRTHSRETSFACLYCGQTFVQKSKLTYHIRKHTGENLESCTVCSKLFTSACSLREHMKIHVEKREVVKCPLCDKKYQDERYMLRHLRTSHTRSQFTCPLCQKVVTSSTGLRHHVITHSRLNTFRCKCCPKSYAVKRTIVKHLRKRHSLSGTEINIKDFYTRLDPRECELQLDETTMCSIFGPPKKKVTNLLLNNFVAIRKGVGVRKEIIDKKKIAHMDEEKGSDKESAESEIRIKQEVQSDEDLEPTDFVSVKIEHIDEYDDEMV